METDSPKPSRTELGGYLAAVGILLSIAIVLLTMGREPICKCGVIKFWNGQFLTSDNSQHLSDWYTPSHVIHGVVFFGLLWFVGKKWPLSFRLCLAIMVEGAWEIFENTDFIINRYRTATIALDYYGDSVINSVSDITAMAFGFYIASRLPVWASIALVVALELIVLAFIRDNLTLNIIMLLYPLDIIKEWQAGA
jgi:hypothetical protein